MAWCPRGVRRRPLSSSHDLGHNTPWGYNPTMQAVEGFVRTERADLYLARLSQHASQMQRHFGDLSEKRHEVGQPPRVERVRSSGGDATLKFTGGRCVLWAQPEGLRLRVEAQDQRDLRRLQDGVDQRLRTLGTRDGLRVAWRDAEIA